MKFHLTALILFVSTFGFSQSDFTLTQFTLKDSTKIKTGLWIEQSFNSNVINNSVVFNLAMKNGPTFQSMQNMKNRVNNSNRAGYNGFERVYYVQKLNSKSDSVALTGFFSLHSSRQITAKFGEDALRLIAYGNKEFAGKKADVNNLNVLLQQYTSIQFGITRTRDKKTFGIAPSVVIGNKMARVNSEGGFLYTSPIGDSVYAEAKGTFSQNDTSSKLAYDPNGIGAAIDLFYSMPFDIFRKNESIGQLTFEVNDLGFMVWNKNTLTYSIDGNYSWAGFKAPTLFDLNDSIISSQQPNDIERSFLRKTESGTINAMLPVRFSVRYAEQLNDRVLLTANLQQRFFSNMLPFIGLDQEIRLNDGNKPVAYNLRFHESFGGYNYAGLGAGFSVSAPAFDLVVGSRNIIGLTNPEYFSGFNVHLGFHWKFF